MVYEPLNKFPRVINARHYRKGKEGSFLKVGPLYYAAVRKQPGGAVIGDYPAVCKDDATGSIFQHKVHIVGYHHYGYPLPVQLQQELHYFGIVAKILPGGRLIQYYYAGTHGQYGCHGDPLFLPEAQGGYRPVPERIQAAYLKGIKDLFLHRLRLHPVQCEGKAHFIRSIMESLGYLICRNLEAIDAMGLEVAQIRTMGGGSKSDLWNQIKADITGKTLHVTYSSQDTACLGAAILAGTAVGTFESVEAAVNAMVRVKKTYEPDAARHAVYEKQYRKFKLLFQSVQELYRMDAED